MKRGRPSTYVHLLRAMRPGDVLYLTGRHPRLDRAVVASVGRAGGKVETACFVAVNSIPELAHTVVRVTCIKPLKG